MSLVLQILLFLALITLASKGAGALSTRLGQPAVFGEILAGLLLGPSLLNVLDWGLFAPPAGGGPHADLPAVVQALAEIGVVLLMFVAGLETDLGQMRRVGRVAFWAACGGVVLPFGAGAAVAHLFGYGWSEGFFIGAVLTATSVSISAQTLMEIGSLRSKEGSAILGAAVIDDVMGIIVLSLVVAFAGRPAGAAGAGAAVLWIALRMTLFFLFAWLLGRACFERAAAAAGGVGVSEPLTAFVVTAAFLYAWAAEYLGGVAAITGSYMAGVLFAQTSSRERIDRGIRPLTYAFLVPVFFINIGLRADVRPIVHALPLTLCILGVAVLAKVIGCGAGAWLSGFRRREALRVGVGMISRGEVGLIVAGYGLAHGIIGSDLFSVMVLMILITTMITPLGLRLVFPRTGGRESAPIFESVAHLERRDDPK